MFVYFSPNIPATKFLWSYILNYFQTKKKKHHKTLLVSLTYTFKEIPLTEFSADLC